mmetsp:Transcript_27831/g.49418  ORF Transcript_27831/g.49418 Transcript_27831/m.49418 type:complete len:286 (-) Transcript_27831:395-1252(-)
MDLIVRLECRSHLLVRNYFNNFRDRSIRVFLEKLTSTFDGKLHGTFIINTGLRLIIFTVIVRDNPKIILLPKHGFLKIILVVTILFRCRVLLRFLFILFLVLLVFLLLLIIIAVILALLLAFLAGFLILLVLSQNVVCKLVVHIHHLFGSTGSTLVPDSSTLDLVVSFGQTAVGTQDEDFNVTMEHLLKRVIRVRTIDNGPIRVFRVRRLSTKFASEELVDLAGSTVKTQADIRNVWNDRLDTIATSFDFSVDSWHFVTIFWIVHWSCSRNIDDGSSTNWHDCNL